MSVIEEKTEELVTPILKELDFNLYDIEYIKEGGENYLRVYIDKEGGITSDDTTVVCRKLSDLIDKQKSFISEKYILEVSSPGLTRSLTKPKHFTSAVGKDVEFKLYKSIEYEETAKEFIGRLDDYDEEKDLLTIGFDHGQLKINRNDIASIHLWIDF